MRVFFKLIILSLAITSCSAQSTFFTFSKKIGQLNPTPILKKESIFKEARRKVYDNTPFLQKKNIPDTIFLLETYNIETATVYGRIWTKHDNISYAYRRISNGNGLVLGDQKAFTNLEISLIQKWDTVTFKKERSNSNYKSTRNTIMAARYFEKGGKEILDHVYFEDFFDPRKSDQ